MYGDPYLHLALLESGLPWPAAFPLAGLLAGALGTLLALPVLRLHGVHLALATLALSMLIPDLVLLAGSWTGGVDGLVVPPIVLFELEIDRFGTPYRFYYLTLAIAIAIVIVIGATMLYANLLRTPLGRSFGALRDSEISARAMGIVPTRTRAGALFSRLRRRRSPAPCSGTPRATSTARPSTWCCRARC